METQWIHTLAAASASPPSSSLLRQTGPTQTSLRRKTSTTRRRERTRWRDRGNTPVHRLYPFLISLTALAAALVFLKHFYTTCVIGSRAPLRSSTLTTFTFPPSFPSSPSIPSSPLPLQLSSGSASTGPLHRRLAETPWRGTQHGAPTICQTDDDRGGENSSDRQGHSESAETQTRGQGGGTGEEGSSNSRRRRRRPVHEAGEDERKDGDTIGTTHGDASPTESELAPSSKRKRHTFQDEEAEDEIDTDPLLGEEAAILSFESENLGLAAPERNPCNGLSELELESLLFQQHLIPKHGEILAFFSFSTKLYRSLKSDIRRRIRIAVGPKGKTGSVGTLLRKLAVAIFLSRQFEWIQSSLPPHIRHYVETKDQKAHAALKQTIREVLFDLLGNTREDCLHAVQVELLRTALAASGGAYVEDTHWHRDITLRDLDEDDYTEMLKTHANGEATLSEALRRSARAWTQEKFIGNEAVPHRENIVNHMTWKRERLGAYEPLQKRTCAGYICVKSEECLVLSSTMVHADVRLGTSPNVALAVGGNASIYGIHHLYWPKCRCFHVLYVQLTSKQTRDSFVCPSIRLTKPLHLQLYLSVSCYS
ncbi:hypothetical protein TGGT1_306235 [Toxoplasma gondii GT1]|uniref:Transmembrane protein n=3 Tax=Toxoplasma gondii TaxID=5811 RepID=S7VWM0_TOXGG|nr:hypothetical protein TGGT1_306235 [Toxoplasma gondii GT1]KFH09428.1 putative transmembrane protein [Toxoplasma gondii MAS]RQX67954.1 putative transmembrane protein [Toxoplasma gondii CAST]